jgi:hypothetical protein
MTSQSSMTLQEKTLYHQIHPLKLGTDIISAVVSVYFLWIHNLPVALLVMFIPAFVASGVLITVADFTWIRDSAVGRYLKWSMTRDGGAAVRRHTAALAWRVVSPATVDRAGAGDGAVWLAARPGLPAKTAGVIWASIPGR